MNPKFLIALIITLIVQNLTAQEIGIINFGPVYDRPVNIKHAGDSRLFVVEQDGYIQILNSDGTGNSTPFLNIDARVINSSAGDERGLLGLAFHPNYATNGYFYVNYINLSNDTVISRFSRSTGDANLADPSSELILLTINQPANNHNGGDMAFGPDNYLYISSGDGGGSGDPVNYAQSLTTLLGKLLRIDVDNTSGGNNYAIPSTNPFVGNSNAEDEIWAYGLRNPWKFSFDRDTDDLWIADVGQTQYEEINKVSSTDAGLNYGWRCYEGNNVFNNDNCPNSNTLTFPVGEYSHNNSGNFKCSITGGYCYRGSMFPNFQGRYFFADYCSNEIGFITQNGANWDMTLSTPFSNNFWTAFAEDNTGELYIAGLSSGQVYKIIDNTTLSLEATNADTFDLFPNPTTSNVTLEFKNANSNHSIAIFNVLGEMVYTNKTNKASMILTLNHLSNGIYIIKITDGLGNKQSKKLVLK